MLFDNWKRHYLASCWEGPSSFISNSYALKIKRESRLVPVFWKPGSKSRVYSSLESIRNQTLSSNLERRYLAGCLEGPSSFISNSSALKIKRESRLVPGKETGFQKSCVQYSGVYQDSNAFRQLEKTLPG
jgi:hypothetical protein